MSKTGISYAKFLCKIKITNSFERKSVIHCMSTRHFYDVRSVLCSMSLNFKTYVKAYLCDCMPLLLIPVKINNYFIPLTI